MHAVLQNNDSESSQGEGSNSDDDISMISKPPDFDVNDHASDKSNNSIILC